MDITALKTIEFRRKFWKIFGAEVRATDPQSGELVGIIRTKALKLREDIRLKTPDESQELVRIHARQIIDFGATYDVFVGDETTPRFSMQRKGLKSTFVRDYWKLLDPSGTQFGAIQETSGGLAIMRRWVEVIPIAGDFLGLLLMFITQSYGIYIGDEAHDQASAVATILHRKNPFVVKMELTQQPEQPGYSPLYGISAVALLSVIDAAKN